MNSHAVNLDAMTADELWSLYLKARGTHRRNVLGWHPLPKGWVRARRDVANYAANKATAMRCRERGDIAAAEVYELICDKIYNELPYWAKW